MPHFYASKGITHKISCVKSPQQNGRVERKHHHILNIARALLVQANIPTIFWSYVFTLDVYTINRFLSPILNNKSPRHMLFKEVPDLHVLKVIGSLTCVTTLRSHRTKLDSRGKKCVFLEFKQGAKGVVLLDVNNHDIFISSNVVHHEHIFPYKPNWNYYTSLKLTTALNDLTPHIPVIPNPKPFPLTPDPAHVLNPSQYDYIAGEDQPIHIQPDETFYLTPEPDIVTFSYSSAIPSRTRNPPSHVNYYVCSSSSNQCMPFSSGLHHPISSFHSFKFLSPSHKSSSYPVTLDCEQNTYEEA